MPPRVCILAETTPFGWVTHYVRAFRRCCDVFTVGPAPSADDLARWGLSHLAHLVEPNDVTVDLGELEDLATVLPGGWAPDLVVAIACNGRPAYLTTQRLECPSVFISIDTWQCLVDYEHARHYDLVFVAQREFVPAMRAMGARHVTWLPLAADPEVHCPVEAEADHDLVFVGTANAVAHRERAALLERLAAEFTCHRECGAYGEDYRRAFARGRLAFNRSAMEDLNMRVFEALAMGRCLLTDRQAARNGLLDCFEDGKHLITYDGEADLLTKARRYLSDEAARAAIGAAGRAEVLAHHTYDHRVRAIFDTVAEHAIHTGPRPVHGLLAYLPRIPGVVVDVGLTSRATKHALRRLGAKRFVGLAVSGASSVSTSRYDAVAPWPGEGLRADTALVADPAGLPGSLDDALRQMHALLEDGGALVLVLSDRVLSERGLSPDSESLTPWLRARDFHMLHGTRAEGGAVVVARKRTRRLREILTDFEDRFSAVEGAFEAGALDCVPEDA